MRPTISVKVFVHSEESVPSVEKGLENHSVLRSLFETARRQGRKAHQFFWDLFTQDTAQAQAALYRKADVGKPRPPLRC